MADVPFLGCKISLISKCDIRYEGILYCVDAKESTIALSKVKSYGTETRGDPSCYVAPKNDVYDIIIFRASDVKDLRVDAPEPPGLSDPAIISAHQSHPGQSSSSFNNINNITTAATQATTNNSGAPTLISNGSLSATGPSNQQQQQSHQQQQAAQPQQNKHQPGQQQHQKPLLPFLPAGSKGEQLDQQNPNLPTINYSSAAANAQRRARTEQRDNKRSDDAKPSTHDSGRDQGRRDDRRVDTRDDRRDGRRDERRDDRRNDRRGDDRRPNRRDDRRGDRHDDVGRRGGGGGGGGDGRPGARMSRGGGFDRDRSNGNHVNSSNNMRYNNNRDNNRDINGYQSRRGGPNNRDSNNSKNGGPMYRRGPMQGGGRRGRSNERTSAPRGPRKGVPLKFEGEYDFDEANKLFLELDGKFKGLKIKGDADKDGAESSGEGNNSKSPAGQSESGSDYDSEDQNNKDGDSKDGCGESVSGEFYDKTKSFFDNISCEASERSQGKVNKPDWRKERQLNTETFGVSSSYRRGGYRGRVYGANGYHRR